MLLPTAERREKWTYDRARTCTCFPSYTCQLCGKHREPFWGLHRKEEMDEKEKKKRTKEKDVPTPKGTLACTISGPLNKAAISSFFFCSRAFLAARRSFSFCLSLTSWLIPLAACCC